MSFTNYDLKLLKEEFPGFFWKCLGTKGHSDYSISLDALIGRLGASEAMQNFLAHDDYCIRNRNEGGEPTKDGGYIMKYAGKWYSYRPIDETPKCNCGLDYKYDAWRKSAEKDL